MRRRRWAGGRSALVAGVAAAALGGAWGCGGPEPAPGPGPEAAAAAPGRGVAVERVTETGFEWASGSVASARRTSVASQVMARIEEMRVRAGSEVAAGDVLVVLDARDLQARVQEVQEARRGAEASAELAAREVERARKLMREGVTTRQRLDQLTSQRRVADAEVERLRQSLEEARTALSFTSIRSPVSGRVVDRLAEPGDTAVPGEPLLNIYDPTALRVEVPVRESLAVALRPGQALEVEVPALGERFQGDIDEIVPFAEAGARTLLVKVRLPGHPKLFAGLYAKAAVPVGAQQRLLVPDAAVERLGQLAFVTVLDAEGGASRRPVTTGRRDAAGRVEVLSGLAAGERVAVP